VTLTDLRERSTTIGFERRALLGGHRPSTLSDAI
jgi:hypothetical protein